MWPSGGLKDIHIRLTFPILVMFDVGICEQKIQELARSSPYSLFSLPHNLQLCVDHRVKTIYSTQLTYNEHKM